MLDASSMADLGANTIRVYHVDSTADHDACMSAFAAHGIYLFLDLDTFDTQFDQASQERYCRLGHPIDLSLYIGITGLESNSIVRL